MEDANKGLIHFQLKPKHLKGNNLLDHMIKMQSELGKGDPNPKRYEPSAYLGIDLSETQKNYYAISRRTDTGTNHKFKKEEIVEKIKTHMKKNEQGIQVLDSYVYSTNKNKKYSNSSCRNSNGRRTNERSGCGLRGWCNQYFGQHF